MDEIYHKRTCEICGNEVYEKYMGETDMDGGFTRVQNFESSGYGIISIPGKPYITACPNCVQECTIFLNRRHDTFIGGPIEAFERYDVQ